jgi:hypothetical protein
LSWRQTVDITMSIVALVACICEVEYRTTAKTLLLSEKIDLGSSICYTNLLEIELLFAWEGRINE